ncbi:MAG: response regulator [Minisyncoccia bacterium]
MTTDSNKKLILIVEDEKILSNLLKEKLEEEGFDVAVAYDGLEFLRLALERHPDLILLDILIPKVDGMTMLKKFREDPWGAHANVIILTNISDVSKMAEGVEIGLDRNTTYEYLVKSNWPISDVVSKIKERLKIKD